MAEVESPPTGPASQAARQRWMAILAKAHCARLEAAWDALPEKPDYVWLRRPETGLVMVRARMGGTGDRFNLGEMTTTRCTVRLDDGTVGVGYVAGRDQRHAALAALFDALLQDDVRRETLERELLVPLTAAQAERRQARARKVAATKVDFFTMVRGEDA